MSIFMPFNIPRIVPSNVSKIFPPYESINIPTIFTTGISYDITRKIPIGLPSGYPTGALITIPI